MSIDIKCEGCGGGLKYNPDKQGLHCANCGSVKPIDSPVYTARKPLTAFSAPGKQINSVDTSLKCESCGAGLNSGDIIDTKCPYCGSHQINAITDGLDFLPDSIIPFTISKEKAKNIFKLWISKRKFAPNKLKKEANLGEIKGVYFPCWLYDYETLTEYNGIGIRESRDSDGDVHISRHRVNGTTPGSYKNQIEPANDMLNDMSIEQFRDYANVEQHEYHSGYLLGFSTANNTNNVTDAFEREKRQKALEIENRIKRQLGYDRYENFTTTTNFMNVTWSYTLLPVWISEYTYGGKTYKFIINGRTGNIVGKAPKSKWKIFFTALGSVLVGALFILLILLFELT